MPGKYPMVHPHADIKSSVIKVSVYTLFCLVLLCVSTGLEATDNTLAGSERQDNSSFFNLSRLSSLLFSRKESFFFCNAL